MLKEEDEHEQWKESKLDRTGSHKSLNPVSLLTPLEGSRRGSTNHRASGKLIGAEFSLGKDGKASKVAKS